MRVVLDSNILVSGLIAPGGTPARLLDAWLDGRFTLVSHALQLDEVREVTRRPKIRGLIRPAETGRLVNRVAALAEMPARLPPVERSRDPRDDFLLALCEAGPTEWLVTGDKDDLLALERHHDTRIVSAAAFSEILTKIGR